MREKEAMKSTQKNEQTTPETVHGYIKAKDKEKIQNRLRRIEGQVRGVQRMVDEEAYCVDILTQIGSVVSALEKVGTILLKDHVEHCVRKSIEKGEGADEKIEELTNAVERFLKV
ncbi:MAG: CsoR family transcriptional regulator, copper-sensing transcriptional repressor [Rubrobacteraceae bacterium]|nr:CsoR family transcriptional regulator, copper-sensing transcriptional repressor [Rubrobacteraceae bacterium]